MAANNLTNPPRPRIIAAWVDREFGLQDTHLVMKQHFARLSSFIEQWYFFETPNEFNEFLEANPKIQLFVIMSGRNAQQIVPAKHIYQNIHCMYVFCVDVNNHRHLKDDYEKVMDIMNIEEDLYERIADDLSILWITIGESSIRSEDRGLARNNLEEAIRLMRDTLHFKNDHGRMSNANELLESPDHM